MTDGEVLFRNILTDPADDLARLVYADWLNEHDQPERAEFIRLGVERHARGKTGLGRREHKLVREEWVWPIPAFDDGKYWGLHKPCWRWSRGFLDYISLSNGVLRFFGPKPSLLATPLSASKPIPATIRTTSSIVASSAQSRPG